MHDALLLLSEAIFELLRYDQNQKHSEMSPLHVFESQQLLG